jgi:predicted AAA+ superfamily ATPase
LEPQTSAYGTAFEHFIINEAIRLNFYLQLDFEFSYYRTEHGAEVDLIIERPGAVSLAVEIKSAESPSVSDIRGGLISFRTTDPKARLLCVCNAPRPRCIDDFEIIPWRDFFDEFFRSN